MYVAALKALKAELFIDSKQGPILRSYSPTLLSVLLDLQDVEFALFSSVSVLFFSLSDESNDSE